MNSIDFLMKVWDLQCKPGDYVCVSSKGESKGSWRDGSFKYDGALRDKLSAWMSRNEGKSLYFCPLPFTAPTRSKEKVRASRLLWSDIDEADYSQCEPSILWRSSPGRHQGLWLLDKEVPPDRAAEMSKKMAYFLGADKGGWDLTQVLRIPGTPNTKYPQRPLVKLLQFTDAILKKVPVNALERWRSTIPRKLLRIIEGPAEQGKRSDMLWFLEHELSDLGIPLKDVFAILRNSDWNKYKGRDDEDERFEVEMEKIREDRGQKGAKTRVDSVRLEVVRYSELLASQKTSPGWMVRNYWMRGSHGIIAGEPKSFKSTLAMDMLTSVAADKPFLGQPVDFGGPVVIVQNENADWIMKDRQEKMAFSKGEVGKVKVNGRRLQIEWPRELPMFYVNQQGFMLDDAANKEALEELIDEMRPAAVQLDPLYLMFSGDVNSAKDLNEVLQWCLGIKQRYNTAVILVHHYGKGNADRRGGQRMLGSTTLHGWIESAWYMQVQDPDEESAIVTLEREFRGAAVHQKLDIRFEMGEYGDPRYSAIAAEHKEEAAGQSQGDQQDVMDVLANSTDLMAKAMIAKKAGMSRYTVDKVIEELLKDGQVYRKGERYGLNKRANPKEKDE